jgi:hypothetical protein
MEGSEEIKIGIPMESSGNGDSAFRKRRPHGQIHPRV